MYIDHVMRVCTYVCIYELILRLQEYDHVLYKTRAFVVLFNCILCTLYNDKTQKLFKNKQQKVGRGRWRPPGWMGPY